MMLVRVAVMFMIVLTSSVFIPHYFWKANTHENKKTNVFYSPILKDFIFIKSDVRETYYVDGKGGFHTREEFELLLPFLNFRQLTVSGKMPDSIDGIRILPREVNLNNINIRVQPAMVKYRPLQIFPLFESASGRLRLELSPDFFRIAERMEFVTSLTNTINEEKSVLFTDALMKQGFAFPARSIYGNPSTKKPFDEGYFVIDRIGKVFHIKMVKGKPFCVDTGIPSTLDIAYIAVTENELRESYALIVTKKDEVFCVSYDHYALKKIPVDSYDHENHTLLIKGDLFYRVITIQQQTGYKAIVTDRQNIVIADTSEQWPGRETTAAGVIASYLFPFTMAIEKDSSPYIGVYFTHSGVKAILLSSLVLLFVLYYFRKYSIPVRNAAVYSILIACSGLYGLIALLVVKDFDDDAKVPNKGFDELKSN